MYMQPGQFRVPMKTISPHLLPTIQRGGYLIITDVYLGDPRGFTVANLMAAARYTGIVLEPRWRNGVLTIEGAGLPWILGDTYGTGWPSPSVGYIGANLSTVVADDGSGGLIPSCFTIGTVTNSGSTHSATWDSTSTVLEAMATAMTDCAAHYKIQPDGSIDAEAVTSNNIYRADPITVLTEHGGDDALWNGARIVDIESSTSMREWLSATGETIVGLNDIALQRADTQTTDPTRMKLGGVVDYTRITMGPERVQGAGVGDTVYVYHPGNGFTGSDRIWFRGLRMNPATHRIHEHEWDVLPSMGVYYHPPAYSVDAADLVDLSQTVESVPVSRATSYLRSLDVTLQTQCS